MKKIVRINEQYIRSVISESLKRRLMEDYDYGGYDGGEEGDEDDWRLSEPTEEEVGAVIDDLSSRCSEFGLTFRDLGDNEFGVLCKVGNDGIPSGNVPEFLKCVDGMKASGLLMQLGGGVTNSGIWHRKYRILKGSH